MSGSAFRREHVSGCGLSAHPMQQCSDPKDTWMSMLVVSPAHLRLVGLIRFSSVHCWPSRKLDVIRFRWGALARNRNRNRSKPLKFPSIQWQLSGKLNLQGSSTNIFGRQREEVDFFGDQQGHHRTYLICKRVEAEEKRSFFFEAFFLQAIVCHLVSSVQCVAFCGGFTIIIQCGKNGWKGKTKSAGLGRIEVKLFRIE